MTALVCVSLKRLGSEKVKRGKRKRRRDSKRERERDSREGEEVEEVEPSSHSKQQQRLVERERAEAAEEEEVGREKRKSKVFGTRKRDCPDCWPACQANKTSCGALPTSENLRTSFKNILGRAHVLPHRRHFCVSMFKARERQEKERERGRERQTERETDRERETYTHART